MAEIVTIKKTRNGQTTFSHCPANHLDEVVKHFEEAGFEIEIMPEVEPRTRFISLDEQRAAQTAIEEEQHHSHFCPDCGREMEFDGVWYCEYCEG